MRQFIVAKLSQVLSGGCKVNIDGRRQINLPIKYGRGVQA